MNMNLVYIIDDKIIFGDSVSVRYDAFMKVLPPLMVGSLLLTLFFINKTFFFVGLLASIGLLSIIPLRVMPGLGVDLIFFLTFFTAYQFGFWWAFVMSKILNLAWVIITGDLELNLLYDLAALTVVALIASFQPDKLTALGMLVVYHIGYNVFNKLTGSDDTYTYIWSGTHLAINIFLISTILPLLLRLS